MKPAGLIVPVLVFLLFFTTKIAKADVAAAGNVSYEWISDSTYRVYFQYYRICHSFGTAPTSFRLCVYNNCTNQTYAQQMNRINGNIPGKNIPNGSALRLLCDSTKNRCNNTSGVFNGVREWWYSVIITLPRRCAEWRFSVIAEERQRTDNLSSSQHFHSVASLYLGNNNPYQNSSTKFSADPVLAVCMNQPATYNNGAYDVDGDSLAFGSVNPKTGTTNTCPMTIPNATYETQTPALNPLTNPLRSGNSFSLSNTSGTSIFTPVSGISNVNSVVTYYIEEYRNGHRIGSCTRDVLYMYSSCSGPQPALELDTPSIAGAVINGGQLTACIDDTVSFCFDIKSAASGASIKVTDNSSSVFPSSALTYTGQGTDSVRGCFDLITGLSDTGLHSIVFSVVDSNCSSSSLFLNKKVMVLYLYVAPPVNALEDTIICSNQQTQLLVYGGWKTYNWQILSGTTGSLSCTNCSSPVASPTVSSVYRVTTPNSVCPIGNYYADTVEVDVHTTPPTNPTISISANPGTTVSAGTTVDYTANVTACTSPTYQWILDGSPVIGQTGASWTGMLPDDQDRIECRLTCNDVCATPKVQLSNKLVMTVTNAVNSVNGDNKNLSLYPNPNNGSFILETKYLDKNSVVRIEIVNAFGQLVYETEQAQKKQNISISNLVPGVYLLRVSGEQNRGSLRFIVQ